MKRLVDAEGRMSSPVDAMRQVRQRRVVRLIDLHKTNKRSIDELDEDDADLDLDDSRKQRKHGSPPHQLQLHDPAPPESPIPIADDAATEPDVEILDSPAEVDEFHDAIEQMDRQIDQLEQPPDSPYSYAPTTPAETVIADNDAPNNNDDNNSNDANTTAVPPNEMPADEDLPLFQAMILKLKMVHPWQLTLCLPAEMTSQLQQLTLCLLTMATTAPNKDAATWIKERWLGSEISSVREDPWMRPKNDSEQKRQRIFNSVELGFYSSNGEHNQFAGDILPDGWTYDEVSNSCVLGKTQDFWSVEEGFLVRNHAIARDPSWRSTADAIQDVPIKLGDLQALKITTPEGASTMMVDSVAAAERKISKDGFFGKTLFPLTKEAAQKLKMPYINPKKKISKSTSGSMENSPSEVWMAATHPLKKEEGQRGRFERIPHGS